GVGRILLGPRHLPGRGARALELERFPAAGDLDLLDLVLRDVPVEVAFARALLGRRHLAFEKENEREERDDDCREGEELPGRHASNPGGGTRPRFRGARRVPEVPRSRPNREREPGRRSARGTTAPASSARCRFASRCRRASARRWRRASRWRRSESRRWWQTASC